MEYGGRSVFSFSSRPSSFEQLNKHIAATARISIEYSFFINKQILFVLKFRENPLPCHTYHSIHTLVNLAETCSGPVSFDAVFHKADPLPEAFEIQPARMSCKGIVIAFVYIRRKVLIQAKIITAYVKAGV